MQNIIIGTAGHIDHGKTTLIKALTGRSTDKLAEEIKRGISINLGFTYFDLPSGNRAGIVDVPGHERFIKNMLAGATGLDVVLLTVAANEGVKPQTVEHVDILSFLDIKERVVVLTKSDLADEEMLELVTDDVRERLSGTPFDDAEIIAVDSLSGRGLDELIRRLDEISLNVKTKNTRAAARLPIDRVFSLKGFGTIVTGTLSEGKISVGDELTVYPKMLKAKIRGVEVHDKSVETAYAGQRSALNISNLKRDELERGDVLAQTDTMTPTDILDVKLRLISHTDQELSLWDRVRVYTGASEVLARVVPLDCNKIEKGGEAFCQLRLEKTSAAKKGDNFVLRTFSPLVTIGGGVILDPNPKKHGKADKKALSALIAQESSGAAPVEEFIKKSEAGRSIKEICAYISADERETDSLLSELAAQGAVFSLNSLYFHTDTLRSFGEACIERLSDFHRRFPLRRGMKKEELRSRVSKFTQKEFDSFLKILENEGEINIYDNSTVALRNFSPVYTPEQEKMKAHIEKALEEAGFAPPPVESVLQGLPKGAADVFESLSGKSVIMLDAHTAIHKKHYESALNALSKHMEEHKQITLAEFRDLINSSRKYAMMMLDYFDKRGITLRAGDARVLAQPPTGTKQ